MSEENEMTMKSDNTSGNVGATGMPTHETANPAPGGTQGKKALAKWAWLAGAAAVALLLFYLWQVFMAAFMFSQFHVPGYFVAKEGVMLPIYPEELRGECVPVFKATEMTPYADSQGQMHRFPEFRERGSFWLLDWARTEMYEAELLKHPNCLPFLLQEMAAAKNHVILVFYDKATKSDVLVIRNYP